MTAPTPGWYPDPAGQPGLFRWWTGSSWTADVTNQPPGPPVPPPASGAAPQAGPAGQPPNADPYSGSPYAGSSYPGTAAAMGPTSTESEPGGSRGRRALVITLAVVLVLGLAAGGGYWFLQRDADSTTAAETGAAGDSDGGGGDGADEGGSGAGDDRSGDRGGAEGDSEDARPGERKPGRAEADEPEQGTKKDEGATKGPETGPDAPADEAATLSCAPLPGWEAEPSNDGLIGIEQDQNTERPNRANPQGWKASLFCGRAPNADVSNLPAQAKSLAQSLAKGGFNGPVRVVEKNRENRQVRGHRAFLLEQEFRYSFDGVKSTSEEVTFLVVDLGPGNLGVLYGSIPETHKHLQRDVDRAITSVRISG